MKTASFAAVWILILASAFACAQETFPSKPIRWTMPFTPGSGQDVFGRMVGPKLAERLGQPVVIENKAGGGGLLGFEFFAKAAPDGYNIAMSNNSLLMMSAMQPTPYDPLRDFAPVMLMGHAHSMIMVHQSLPVNSLAELIAYSKAHPGKLNYGSPATGTFGHLTTELFKMRTGADFVHIPHKGITGAVQGLITGDVTVLFGGEALAVPHIKSGKVKLLAAAGQRRSPFFPEVPSAGELGVKDFDPVFWYGLLVPAGTRSEFVSRFNAELRRVLSEPQMKEDLMKRSIEPATSTPEQFGNLMRTELATWQQVIKVGNVKPD